MYFNKVETPSNFTFSPECQVRLRLDSCGAGVFHLSAESKRWPLGHQSFAPLDASIFANEDSLAWVQLGSGGELAFGFDSQTILCAEQGRGFGLCASKWMFVLPWDDCYRVYGCGEKTTGFEHSGKRTLFWNTDVFADFAFPIIEKGATDPMYASFPVIILRKGEYWIGIVINNPFPVFANMGALESIMQIGAHAFKQELSFGARNGSPDIYFMVADNPRDIVQRVQRLQGTSPLPPLWALGHHQCRWGYRSPDDLTKVADGFEKNEIPNDGLWLDIDYMDGYRVFTTSPEHFSNTEAQLAALNERGYKVVPILDPGLRKDPEYSVYAEAKALDILCKTPENTEFVGFVWPGYTVFPDYSLVEGRQFWADQVEKFTKLGFAAYWIDMNDPSTGTVPLDDMRFGKASLGHDSWHNQYALGMAVSTQQGLLQARPNERPFVISRSAFLGQARYSAVWTGDNISNEHHMKNSIPLSLNLSVSGMPFNGPDVPGFADNASSELMRDWYKLGFLFPFFRNHSIFGSQNQEPWTRDSSTTLVVKKYIQMRYRMLPYLYQVFVDQFRYGSPILRPVWYHDSAEEFSRCADVFFTGDAILQAPFTELQAHSRTVTLPVHSRGEAWFDPDTSMLCKAGDSLLKQRDLEKTPLFLACPGFIPMQTGIPINNRKDLMNIDAVLVLAPGKSIESHYYFDDGISLQVNDKNASEFILHARMDILGKVSIDIRALYTNFGELSISVVLPCMHNSTSCRLLEINGNCVELEDSSIEFAGSFIKTRSSQAIKV